MMFDDGYTDYCKFLISGASMEELQAQDMVLGCMDLLESSKSPVVKATSKKLTNPPWGSLKIDA